jgi:hypothetical protein
MIKIKIDTDNAAQLEALSGFCLELAKIASGQPSDKKVIALQKTSAPVTVQVPAAKTATAPPPSANSEETPAPPTPEVHSSMKGPGVTIDQIRELVAEKKGDHMQAMKAKLKELGAATVPALDAKHYEEFYTFVKGL